MGKVEKEIEEVNNNEEVIVDKKVSEDKVDVNLVKETIVQSIIKPYKVISEKIGIEWLKLSMIVMSVACILFAGQMYFSIDKSYSKTFGKLDKSEINQLLNYYDEFIKSDDFRDDLEDGAEEFEDMLSDMGINVSINPNIFEIIFKIPYNYLSNGLVFFIKLALFPALYFASIICATYIMLKIFKQEVDIKIIPSRMITMASFYGLTSVVGFIGTFLDLNLSLMILALAFTSFVGLVLLYEALKGLFQSSEKYCYIYVLIIFVASIVSTSLYFGIIF